jgi:hypothetical protein
MSSLSRKTRLAFVVAAAAVATGVLAQTGGNPMVGTWKLNTAKSKFTPGPAPKSLTVKIEAMGEGVRAVSEGVDGDGKPIATEFTANYDGKDYPIKGSSTADTVSLKRTGPRTAIRTDKKNGKVVQTSTREISEDGKSYTFTSEGKNAKGEAFKNVSVYDKQ